MSVVVREQQLAGLRWLVVSGPRRAVFQALGETARADIRAVQQAMPERDGLSRHVSTEDGGALLERVLRATRERHPQELAELEALAEGAGVDFDDLLLANLRGDLGTGDGTGCTDLIWRGDRSFVAHNEDAAPALDGRLMLLTLAIDGLEPVTVQWYPGFVPANTFTATGHGLVWGINHIQVVHPVDGGAGRHFVARAMQQAATLDAALDHLCTRPSAGGFSYAFGERATGRVAIAESAAGLTAVVESTPAEPLHWHTNHLRHLPDSLDRAPEGPADGVAPSTDSLGQYEESVARGRALEKLRPEGPTPSSAWFLNTLTGAPLPCGVHRTAADGDPLMTLCTVVADLTADRIVVRGPQGGTAELPLSDFARGIAPERAAEPPSARASSPDSPTPK
ncbi:C45 family autoproteolytic acyltransferase/hydrolase [Streptomyces sp. NPDC019443]|uniref:C45 family autoproteolytic acyltransferase/hydolase n=1 Tax=Streptomyces sp. NPDC019443 TaxID=3365061 RepID=UPI003796F6D8